MNWRIESDGTPRGTRVYEDGKMVTGIQEVIWHAVIGQPYVAVTIKRLVRSELSAEIQTIKMNVESVPL